MNDDTPTADEFRDWREGHGYTQDEAARRIGVSRRTVQYWEAGTVPVPATVAKLLHAWGDDPPEAA